jgi:hypothetical protein
MTKMFVDSKRHCWYKTGNILLLIVLGSDFGFAVTSCDEDFLGIRNEGASVFGGASRLLFAVAVDGLVSLAASNGGDVIDVLFALAPAGTERGRLLTGSLTDIGIVPCVAFDAPVAAVDVVVVVDDKMDDVVDDADDG